MTRWSRELAPEEVALRALVREAELPALHWYYWLAPIALLALRAVPAQHRSVRYLVHGMAAASCMAIICARR